MSMCMYRKSTKFHSVVFVFFSQTKRESEAGGKISVALIFLIGTSDFWFHPGPQSAIALFCISSGT